MWASVRRQWDYFAIAFVLGLYLIGALALALSLLFSLETKL
jgi:hypothetical protein